ncbi:MAG: FGGY family carbohydrate kinase, partial [Cyclobacteriaceae bacterium]
MFLLGLDIGTSSIKASLINAEDLSVIGAAQYPEEEAVISSPKPGWAEQSPEDWWAHTKKAIGKLKEKPGADLSKVGAIGISYQMHGLVVVDKDKQVLRPSIIWCDSRAVELGEEAFDKIGHERSLGRLLNSPGNFTASKLAWVKQNEKDRYENIDRVMLPGDYIAMMLTGDLTTSVSALSEGIFWDFQDDKLSNDVFDHFGLDKSFIPPVQEVFSIHGRTSSDTAAEVGLPEGIPVTYKAGDQPNNALSLNV